MRCYLMKDGQIHSIEDLGDGPEEDLIEQAIAMLRQRARRGIEGIELWNERRFVYRARAGQIISS